MKIQVSRKVNSGEATFEIDDRDENKALEMLSFLTASDYCSNCKGTNIVWDSNRAKDAKGQEYIYIKRRCLNCRATSTMGKYNSGGVFWKQFEVYDKGSTPAPKNAMATPYNAPESKQTTPPDDIDIEEIPF